MELVKFPEDHERNWLRREINLSKMILGKSTDLQISKLTPTRKEPYHINKKGYVLCVVIDGWMEAHCKCHDYILKQGEGIIFYPGERHRINKGNGWMLSVSSMDYEELKTEWEDKKK